MSFISLNDEVIERIDNIKRITIKANVLKVETYDSSRPYEVKAKDTSAAQAIYESIKSQLTSK